MHLGDNKTEGSDKSPVTYWVNRVNGKVSITNAKGGAEDRKEHGFEQVTAAQFKSFTDGKVFK